LLQAERSVVMREMTRAAAHSAIFFVSVRLLESSQVTRSMKGKNG
jgi:hypothetical protein